MVVKRRNHRQRLGRQQKVMTLLLNAWALIFILLNGLFLSELSNFSATKKRRQRLPKIVVGGIMRNMNEDGYLDYFLPKLLNLVKSITYEFHIVIYENDSNDGTREKLLSTFGNSSFATLILEEYAPDYVTDPGPISIQRTNKIARARNMVLDFVRITDLSVDFDYLYMMDMDGVCGGPNTNLSYDPDIFKYALIELKDQWDGVFFRFEPYWDLWALRIPQLIPNNYWYGERAKIVESKDLGPFLDNLSWPDGMLAVDSAFEMTGIYSMNMIRRTTSRYYGASDASGNADCEHVAFNLGLREQFDARLRISRLVYCQGDDRYEPLPSNLTNKWKNYVSYNDRSSGATNLESSTTARTLASDGTSDYWNVVRIVNNPPAQLR